MQFPTQSIPENSLLPDRDTTSLGVHPGRNIHGCQLLEQKLGRVRQDNLRDFRLVLARSALELVLLERSRTRCQQLNP